MSDALSDTLTLAEFPPVSTADWDAVVLKDQKGIAPKSKLFYRADDLVGLEYLNSTPGEFPFTRGTRPENRWKIREVVHNTREAHAALDAGADEIRFVLGDQNVLEAIGKLPRCAVHFDTTGQASVEVLRALVEAAPQSLANIESGSIDYTPLPDFDQAARLLRALPIPRFRPIAIRACFQFSGMGATPVQQVAFALAEGAETIAQLTARGFTADQAAQWIAFEFDAGSNYFLEIAKFRAARTLWARIVESFGPADARAGKMTVCAHTSYLTKTIYDPYVNVLRATTEAMAAAIGGADSIEVGAFDRTYREPDEASRRLARNTQLILRREAGLDRSVDAAGGSYYLETLTDSFAREAWALFQKVEAAGGFLKYSRAISDDIGRARAERELAVGARRIAIVGTNQYPNLDERMLPKIEREGIDARYARIFEQIRLRTERHAARTGQTPRFLLLEAGDVKMRKARSGFITNFFGCAGFEIRISGELTGDPDAVVLCSSDPEYAALAPRVIQELRAAGKATPVIVAGNPADSIEILKQAGVADFVHARSNAAEVLRAWQERLGVKD
jgi:methylmalonyl-CoA mutase